MQFIRLHYKSVKKTWVKVPSSIHAQVYMYMHVFNLWDLSYQGISQISQMQIIRDKSNVIHSITL